MAYLTSDEYVTRAGEPETIRITDTDKAGVVDSDKVNEALDDQSLFADSYLGTRYVLPITDPPEILKGIVYALAREQLYKNRPGPGVTEAADRARSLLKDLSAGRAILPVAPGDTPADETPTAGAATTNDAAPRIFTYRSLNGFANFNYTYGYPLGRSLP